jgi:hypothetical protein
MMESIIAYSEKKEPLGGFLTAVFANDLFKAVSRADETNLALIPIYCSYIYWELPSTCHGSYEIVKKWIESDE